MTNSYLNIHSSYLRPRAGRRLPHGPLDGRRVPAFWHLGPSDGALAGANPRGAWRWLVRRSLDETTTRHRWPWWWSIGGNSKRD